MFGFPFSCPVCAEVTEKTEPEPGLWSEVDIILDFFYTHLYHTSARVKEDAPFGLLGDLFIFVEVHDVGVIS